MMTLSFIVPFMFNFAFTPGDRPTGRECRSLNIGWRGE